VLSVLLLLDIVLSVLLLLDIVLSVLLQFDLRILITPLVSLNAAIKLQNVVQASWKTPKPSLATFCSENLKIKCISDRVYKFCVN
jgi:hypothetical protein